GSGLGAGLATGEGRTGGAGLVAAGGAGLVGVDAVPVGPRRRGVAPPVADRPRAPALATDRSICVTTSGPGPPARRVSTTCSPGFSAPTRCSAWASTGNVSSLPTPPPRTVIVRACASIATTRAFAYVREPGVGDRSGGKAACAFTAAAPATASRTPAAAARLAVHTLRFMTAPC